MSTALLSFSRLVAPFEPQGTRIADARQALDGWSRRASQLPWRRRAARHEAGRMIATARAQLIGAHLERLGLTTVDRAVTPLLDTGGRSAGSHVRSLAFSTVRRTTIGRKILLGVAGITAGAVAIIALAAALATHLIAL